jgi:hypothetical protein
VTNLTNVTVVINVTIYAWCRGLNVEGEADSWDFGVGAGFYINATEDKWKNWRMYDYITKVQLTNTWPYTISACVIRLVFCGQHKHFFCRVEACHGQGGIA